jgi:molybdopterin synthase sulfur carrier subunit
VRVQVLYFAALRDLAGTASEELALPDSVQTVSDLLAHLEQRETFRGKLSSTRVALNETFSDLGSPLAEGDVVALIPPVQGG